MASNSAYDEVLTPKQLAQQIDEKLENQELGLDEIQRGARRLKDQANGINTEILQQNDIIDDINNNADHATGELRQQADRAKLVNKKKRKLCLLYIIIFVLVMILILIASI